MAGIFREAGVARLEPRKKPRAAWRRFVYPAPNACWQLDATEYVLTRGRKCVIFQLIDDHSRYALASHVAWGETAEAAIVVFDKAVAAHGVRNGCCRTTGPRSTRRAVDSWASSSSTYLVGAQYGFQQVLVITAGDKITVTNLEGEILIEHTRPHPASPTSATPGHADHTPTNPGPSPKS